MPPMRGSALSLSPLVPAQAARDHHLLAVICVGPEVVWEEVLMVEAAAGDERERDRKRDRVVSDEGGARLGCKTTQSSIPS
jgi:hypothetical protein